MPSDLTDDEREAALEAIRSGMRQVACREGASPLAMLDPLIALGWSPRRTGAAETGAGVRVRALEWRDIGDGDFTAATDVGIHYTVIEYPGMITPFKLDVRGAWSDQIGRMFLTLDEAKAAAQADYEARILSALDPAAPTPDALTAAEARGYARGVEAAAKEVEGGVFYHPTAPAALFAKEAARAIRALSSTPPQEGPK